jgi:arsenate reductase-like glutaredoxin family protein
MTPYEKFKSLPNCEQYLKEGITLSELDKIASSMTDLEAAKLMQTEKNKLFKLIFGV